MEASARRVRSSNANGGFMHVGVQQPERSARERAKPAVAGSSPAGRANPEKDVQPRRSLFMAAHGRAGCRV